MIETLNAWGDAAARPAVWCIFVAVLAGSCIAAVVVAVRSTRP